MITNGNNSNNSSDLFLVKLAYIKHSYEHQTSLVSVPSYP